MGDYTEHLISMAGGDGDDALDLDAIQARADAATEFPEVMGTEQMKDDHAALLALVREQAAQIDRVKALAEKWRYKGEFGWGAWQEGHGPDPEGYVLDTCSGEIRTALTATDQP